MLERHGGHKLTCVQDGSFAMPAGVASIVMPSGIAALPDYQPKLWAWSPEFQERVGERFASIDLDVIIKGDLGPLLQTKDCIRLWDHAALERYNTSLFVIQPGFGHDVWLRLTPADLAEAKRTAAYWTGDQSWVSYILGPGAATFGERDGVIQYRPKYHRLAEPPGMLAGFMCGPYEPFSEAELSPWLQTAYR